MQRGILGLTAVLLTMVACAPSETRVTGLPSTGQQERLVVSRAGIIRPGSVVWIVLDEPLSPTRNRVGDGFRAHVSQDVVADTGELLIPRGAEVDGRIVDLRRAEGGQPGVVGLSLRSIEMAGVRQQIDATIVETMVPGQRRVRGRDVLTGAAIGAVLGGLLEGKTGLVVGGALGAGAGTLVSLGTGEATAQLPKGTALAVRFETPVRSLVAFRRRYYD
ncbi:MAG: hypothetical protein V2A73_14425 [Pseudomonadota bacterium]